MKTIIISILAFWLAIFPSCQYLQIQYKAAQFDRVEVQTAIIEAIENRDVEALKELMCQNIKDNVPDLDGKITALYDAIDGEIVENDGWHGTGLSDETANGVSGRISRVAWKYEFKTASKSCRIDVSWVIKDTRSVKNMGLSFIVLRDMKLFSDYQAGKNDYELCVLARISEETR